MKINYTVIIFIIMFVYGCSGPKFLFAPKNDTEKNEYEKYIKESGSDDENTVVLQRLFEESIKKKEWKEAIKITDQYKQYIGNAQFAEKISAILNSQNQELEIKNPGEGINTSGSEYNPVPSFDDKKMYFCGDLRNDGLGGEDIYVSEFKNDKWQKAINMKDINSKSNEAPLSVSGDGNRLILFGNYDDSFGNGDLYYIDKTETGWGKICHFPKPINSDYFDADGFLSADGKAFFFVSDRPGNTGKFHRKDSYFHGSNQGNTDIYVCIRNGNEWSNPINLGNVINTPFAERTPFLHPDGKTLYFSSDGHPGLGRLDVFKSERLSDSSWDKWSEPQNLGKEINTAEDDWGYKVTTNGEAAYFAKIKNNGSLDDYDIYSVTLPEFAKPKAIARIHGKITDISGKPLETDIRIEDLTNGGNIGYTKSDPVSGEYYIVLPLGKNYGYFTDKKGYFPISQNIDLESKNESEDITEDIVLISLEDTKKKDISIRINNIFFETNKSDLKPESFPELNRLAGIIQGIPGMVVEISGHSDNVGNSRHNRELSLKRAQSVVNYLIEKGCDPISITAKGYGDSKPIAANSTEKGRSINRRVEFKILK
jgi:outer membrane protein OmpA-like peptidoglycan-associated protein